MAVHVVVVGAMGVAVTGAHFFFGDGPVWKKVDGSYSQISRGRCYRFASTLDVLVRIASRCRFTKQMMHL